VKDALEMIGKHRFDAALIDYILPDGEGLDVALALFEKRQCENIILTTPLGMSPEDKAICEECSFGILEKPFLISDMLDALRASLPERNWSTSKRKNRALTVFFSYSHKDEKLRNRLDAHLSVLKSMGLIDSWHDRKIVPGDDFAANIDRFLEQADVILLLISPDFLDSRYCYTVEMQRALARHENEVARVIPVILRPVDWEHAPFAHIQALPKNAKPITVWANRDEGLADAAKGIRRAVEELSARLKRA
jgi:hypothetical protein